MTPEAGPVTVYGASGYTGRLISAELSRRGAPFIVAGRNQAKLETLAESLASGPPVEIRSLPTSDREGLRELFSGSGAVIACAGPFILHGEPILEAAVDAGTHYLDTTGEQDFIRKAFEEYGPKAARAGSVVLPAMGFDYVPGDMLAALTAEALGEGQQVDKVRLGYHAPFQPSRGTMRSGIEMIKGGDVEWREHALRPASQAVARPDFQFTGPLGSRLGVQKMMHYPSAEHITVPTHLSPRTVETGLTVASFAPNRLSQKAMPAVAKGLGLAMRTPLRKAMSKAISLMPEGAEAEARASENFVIACEVISPGGTARGTLTGTDVYGLTAALIVEGAARAARGEIEGSGTLAPAAAFDPAAFLGGFARFGLEWEIEAPR